MSGEPTDEELMLRVKAGDAQAFGRLYERHKRAEGVLDFLDLLLKARDALRNAPPRKQIQQ